MGDKPASSPPYPRYGDFLEADPRRKGDALELGHDWRDGDERYRVCWYEETGELTAERLGSDQELELEDFHRGVAGPVEIIARVQSRERLNQLLGEWPNIPDRPHTLGRLRKVARLGGASSDGAGADEPPGPGDSGGV